MRNKLNVYKSNRDLMKFNQENKSDNKPVFNDNSFYASIENTTQELSNISYNNIDSFNENNFYIE